MIWVDYCIVGVLAVSTLIGVIRGFARETLGLLTWVLAIWLSAAFAPVVADSLADYLSAPSVRSIAAHVLLFFGGLLVGGIATALLVRRLRESVLSSTDRTLGAGFGLMRGAVLVAMFVLVAQGTAVRQDPWWRQSLLLNRFEWLADAIGIVVPSRWLDRLQRQGDDAENAVEASY